MSKTNNINLNTINGKYTNQITGTITDVIINNTIKIQQSALLTNNTSDNSNAKVQFKDINSNGTGAFYPLNVDSSESDTPYLYFNNNIIIDGSNLLSELEHILDSHTLETSNIVVKGGYINFWNGNPINSNVGSDGVGLRYSTSNTVQFKNWDTDWIDLVDITKHDQFSELIDVDVSTNPLYNNQYITYNASTMKYTNSNLAILNDISPQLGGDLTIGNNSLLFSGINGSGPSNLVYKYDGLNNILMSLENTSTLTGACNYLKISNSDINPPAITDPDISCQSVNNTDPNVGMSITTKGSGNISLNATEGNIYTNCDALVVSGIIRNSILRSSTKNTGYEPDTTWNFSPSNDIVLFDFTNSNTSGTYYANINTGLDGQKLNLIYNNKGTNSITVLADFGSNGLLVGTGYCTGLKFQTTGQSTSLVYLGEGIDAWQVLNTGASTF